MALNRPSGVAYAQSINPQTLQSNLHIVLLQPPSQDLSSEIAFKFISKLVELNPAALAWQDQYGNLPIHYLCRRGCKDTRTLELFCGSPLSMLGLSTPNGNGQLPIHILCGSGLNSSPDCAQWILNMYPRGAKTTDGNGNLPVHFVACIPENEKLLTQLYELHPLGFTHRNCHGKLPPVHFYKVQVNQLEQALTLEKAKVTLVEDKNNELVRQLDALQKEMEKMKVHANLCAASAEDANAQKDNALNELQVLRRTRTELEAQASVREKVLDEQNEQMKQLAAKRSELETELDSLRKKTKELEDSGAERERQRERDDKTLQMVRDTNRKLKDHIEKLGANYLTFQREIRNDYAGLTDELELLQCTHGKMVREVGQLDAALMEAMDHSADDPTAPSLPMEVLKAFALSLQKRKYLLEGQDDSKKKQSKVNIMFDTFLSSPQLSRSSLEAFIRCSYTELEQAVSCWDKRCSPHPTTCPHTCSEDSMTIDTLDDSSETS